MRPVARLNLCVLDRLGTGVQLLIRTKAPAKRPDNGSYGAILGVHAFVLDLFQAQARPV